MSSQISPNSVNPSFPVAGVDNNSQGFRDNFTSTKNNFVIAKREIDDLMNKVVLKAPLTYSDNPTVVDNNFNGTTIANSIFVNSRLGTVDLGNDSDGIIINVDITRGGYQFITTDGTSDTPTTLHLLNWPDALQYSEVIIEINVANNAHPVAFTNAAATPFNNPLNIAGWNYANDSIMFDSEGTFLFKFSTKDAGQTITVEDVSRRASVVTNQNNFLVNSTGLIDTVLQFHCAPNVFYKFEASIPYLATTGQTSKFSVTFGDSGGNSIADSLFTVENQVAKGSVFNVETSDVLGAAFVVGALATGDGLRLARVTGTFASQVAAPCTISAAVDTGNITVLAGAYVKYEALSKVNPTIIVG